MSPIPPNPQNLSNNNQNNVGNNDLTENEFVLGEEEGQLNTSNGDYQMLNQVPSNLEQNENDDDDDDEDDDDDSDADFDPDLDFEQLATTRAYIQQQQSLNKKSSAATNQPIIETNNNLFDIDFFERKIKLECEEIVLDEKKSKKITEIMANFKLDEKFVPNWARTVPESVWKQNLIDSLNAKKTDLFEIKQDDENDS